MKELYAKIEDLEKRMTITEQELQKLRKKNSNSYASIDSRMCYRADKKRQLKEYNEDKGTDYNYVSESMVRRYKLGESAVDIGETFEVTEQSVFGVLKRKDVKLRRKGGNNRKLNLTQENINNIRASFETEVFLAKEYNISTHSIARIKHRVGRWAKY